MLIRPRALLLLVLVPVTAYAQPQSPMQKTVEEALRKSGQLAPGQTVVIHEHSETASATGAGGEATGDKVTHEFTGSAPTVSLPGAGASGGNSASKGTAEMVTSSPAFRWVAGIIGFLVLLAGWVLGQQGNMRGAIVVGGSGLICLLGAIFFPEWLAVGLLLFFLTNSLEYAWRHGLLTGSLASLVTSVHAAGEAAGTSVTNAFKSAAANVVEPREAALINKAAVKNEAYSVKV